APGILSTTRCLPESCAKAVCSTPTQSSGWSENTSPGRGITSGVWYSRWTWHTRTGSSSLAGTKALCGICRRQVQQGDRRSLTAGEVATLTRSKIARAILRQVDKDRKSVRSHDLRRLREKIDR